MCAYTLFLIKYLTKIEYVYHKIILCKFTAKLMEHLVDVYMPGVMRTRQRPPVSNVTVHHERGINPSTALVMALRALSVLTKKRKYEGI